MRVVAGKFGGRRLTALHGMKLRPTSDRLRETLFNILGPMAQDSVFLDLYAGTGLFTLPLSQDFREVATVEAAPFAFHDLQRNSPSNVTAYRVEADKFLGRAGAGEFVKRSLYSQP